MILIIIIIINNNSSNNSSVNHNNNDNNNYDNNNSKMLFLFRSVTMDSPRDSWSRSSSMYLLFLVYMLNICTAKLHHFDVFTCISVKHVYFVMTRNCFYRCIIDCSVFKYGDSLFYLFS